MAYHQDQVLVERVWRRVDMGLRNKGYSLSAFTLSQIRAKIKSWPNEWDKADVQEGYIKDLVKLGIQRLKKEGIKANDPTDKEISDSPTNFGDSVNTRSQAKTLNNHSGKNTNVTTNAGIVWATVDPALGNGSEIVLEAEKIRQEYWESREPPFSFIKYGDLNSQVEAYGWLETQLKKDFAEHGDHVRYEFRIQLEAKDMDVMAFPQTLWEMRDFGAFRGEDDYYTFRPREHDRVSALRILTELAEKENMNFVTAGGKSIRDHIRLPGYKIDETTVGNGVLSIGVSGLVRRIFDRASVLAEKTGWWKPEQALAYLMTGKPPTPIRTHSGSIGGQFHKLTLEILGPITEEEIIQLYREACRVYGWRAPHFTANDLALMEMHAQTPQMSWPERHARWLEWRVRHPELTDFTKSNPRRAPEKMQTAWKRAVEKVDWQLSPPQL